MSGESDLAAMQSQVAALFPSCVRCALSPVREGSGPVYAEELRAVASAVPSRRREFSCGRACAHRAIRALGCPDGPILVGRHREPVWPAGVVGAISHTAAIAGAAVADAGAVMGIGLDIERGDAVFDAGQRSLVFTPEEMTRFDGLLAEGLPAEVVVFSAKECVHKAVFPFAGLRLDYRDVSIDVDAARGSFIAALHDDHGIGPTGPASIAGRFLVTNAHVITAITLPGAGQ